MKKLVPHNGASNSEMRSGASTRANATLFWLVILSILTLCFEPGCRRAPRNSPEKYESEIAKEAKPAPEPAFLSDNPPWARKNSGIRNLPDRILNKQISLENEMKSVDKIFQSHALPNQ